MLRSRPLLLLVLMLCGSLALTGCGGEDPEQLVDDARAKVREVRRDLEKEAEEARERIRKRVEEILDDLRRAVPEAGPATPVPESGDDPIDRYLTEVLQSVDRYWTRTLKANGLDEPRVSYVWVPDGRRARSACGEPADDHSAFYCPADDTIYVGRALAREVLNGLARGLPGTGRAIGDFGVAYIVAHEYGHNLQSELGFFDLQRSSGGTAKPFELQADCFSGLWANSVYAEGKITEEDVQEAVSTAEAVGDFDFDNAQHHGTPEERRAAWLAGYDSGDPRVCSQFVTEA